MLAAGGRARRGPHARSRLRARVPRRCPRGVTGSSRDRADARTGRPNVVAASACYPSSSHAGTQRNRAVTPVGASERRYRNQGGRPGSDNQARMRRVHASALRHAGATAHGTDVHRIVRQTVHGLSRRRDRNACRAQAVRGLRSSTGIGCRGPSRIRGCAGDLERRASRAKQSAGTSCGAIDAMQRG